MLLMTAEASTAPWRRDPLASLDTAYAVDSSTGLANITVPLSHTLNVLFYRWTFDGPVLGRELWDTQLVADLHESSFRLTYFAGIRPNYSSWDPTGAAAHTWGASFKNMGAAVLEGSFQAPFILEEVGTQRAETKRVKLVCGHGEREVPRQATRVRCPVCGGVSLYAPRLYGMREKAIVEVIE